MAETEIHLLAMLHLIGALRYFFRQQKDVYVIGNMLFYYHKGDPQARRAPDVMVAFSLRVLCNGCFCVI